jgi:hypothetical protein
VRIEHPDGRRETLTPDDALELVYAARIVAANATQPGAAARMEARHLTLALGEAMVDDAPAEVQNDLIARRRVALGMGEVGS